ncbi:hypothetical protein Pst134EB_012341 [Puccinia striiformis f. sp. tritici]|nr:hypothetical protein Pst134EB_012341 [Puccinia striiformis f. sp. tritici]
MGHPLVHVLVDHIERIEAGSVGGDGLLVFDCGGGRSDDSSSQVSLQSPRAQLSRGLNSGLQRHLTLRAGATARRPQCKESGQWEVLH